MIKNILSLDPINAKKFFLKQESYCNLELPPYFNFQSILLKIEKQLKGACLSSSELSRAKQCENINHILYGNKDGKYAWRKYELINPVIYVSLVNLLTDKENWKFLQKYFRLPSRNKYLDCASIPVLSSYKKTQKAQGIRNWLEKIEKVSIPFSLDYNYLYLTDITDCYGSIYTHSVSWALHSKKVAKLYRNYDDLFGNRIDCHIQAMEYGQTNGIPQGSVLMDFIAEIIFRGIDLELLDTISKNQKDENFHILRYRDDYRIFANSINTGDKIFKNLSEVLTGWGLRLNVDKTHFSNSIISSAIKKDKLEALKFGPVPYKLTGNSLIKQLLIIQQIGEQYPNSGTLVTRLSTIIYVAKQNTFSSQNKNEIITGLLIDIAYTNPRTFPFVATLISKCLHKLKQREQSEIMLKIQSKIGNLTNIGLLEIWLQRMSIGFSTPLTFNEELCHLLNNTQQKIFNTVWVSSPSIQQIVNTTPLISVTKLHTISGKGEIKKLEVQVFHSHYDE